jgi:hypothetical protein
MISLTYLPLCVTMLFRGMPDIWKGRHQLILCWLVCMQALSPGQKTLEELARWTPATLTAWRFRRLLQANSWSIHLLGTWWAEAALQTLPPPKDRTLHLNQSTGDSYTRRPDVIVEGDTAYGSQEHSKMGQQRTAADPTRHWGLVFAMARTWKTVEEKAIKALVTHVPRTYSQRVRVRPASQAPRAPKPSGCLAHT